MRAARVAALAIALASPGAATAVEFGTFFHTPDERARLDRLRRGEVEAPVSRTTEGTKGEPALTGYVQRSDGHHTVWIDGRPVRTSGPKAETLFDPRKVRDDSSRIPDSAVKTSPPAPKSDSR